MLKLIFPLILVFATYQYFSLKSALMVASLIFIYFMYQLKLFSSIKLSLGYFLESDIYYQEYQGEYKNIATNFQNLTTILEKFKIKDPNYFLFGIYYDNPYKVKDLTKCRAIYGIGRPVEASKIKDYDDYMANNNFKRSTLPGTQSLTCLFEYIYKISIMIGIVKYYKEFECKMNDEQFRKQFNVRGNFRGSIEVYRENSVQFFYPYEHIEKFSLSQLPEPEPKNN